MCDGRAPSTAEEPYVGRRADAIAALARSLADNARLADDARLGDTAEGPAASVAEARDELDRLTGTSSVDRLLELADRPGRLYGDR